ncbi:uncharacterized protein LOC126572996 [Anopheles aquasalis]|uniref:uncharacterized protein LOC126572996 n=1 Tax=Anopheles aquasalis TaxID=42839 RepID=UPI00215B56A9|nr:uncharacterized protein LOC126572996 [Anopheles aquasalis]
MCQWINQQSTSEYPCKRYRFLPAAPGSAGRRRLKFSVVALSWSIKNSSDSSSLRSFSLPSVFSVSFPATTPTQELRLKSSGRIDDNFVPPVWVVNGAEHVAQAAGGVVTVKSSASGLGDPVLQGEPSRNAPHWRSLTTGRELATTTTRRGGHNRDGESKK